MPILNDIACVDDPPNIDGQQLIGQFATLYQQCKGFRQSLTMRALSSTIQRMMGNRRESTPPVPSRGTVYRLTEVQGSRVGQPRRSQKQRRVASCPTPPIPNRGAGYRPTEVQGGELVGHGCHFLGRTGQQADRAEVMFFGMALLLQFELHETAADAIRVHAFGSLYMFFFQSGITRPWKLGTFYLQIFFALVKALFRGNHNDCHCYRYCGAG